MTTKKIRLGSNNLRPHTIYNKIAGSILMFKSRIKQLGQGMTEYIIIVALIAIAAIAVYSIFGDTVRTQVGNMSKELAGEKGNAKVKGNVDDATGAKGLDDFSN